MHGEMMSAVGTSRIEPAVSPLALEARLLGPFSVATAGHVTGPWPRPSARRICQLVLVSPGRRVTRETACQALFPEHAPEAATKALYKALSMARAVLGELSPQAAELLNSDHSHIWAGTGIALEVDLDAHEQALRAALAASPGERRDLLLVDVLLSVAVPLDDEDEAEWALRVRERIQYLRQEARLELARDRSAGRGRARPEAVLQAWEASLDADPSCEEAASALIRLHAAQGRRQLALAAYERCRAAYTELGLPAPTALDAAHAGASGPIGSASSGPTPGAAPSGPRPAEERRLVTVVAVELTPGLPGPSGDPEDLRELVAGGLARAISEAESLGGSVASVSGTGMSVLFGAPQSHEDDPERALRAALRIVAALGRRRAGAGPASSGAGGAAAGSSGLALSVRVGVETGMAVVGPIGGGGGVDYGPVGAVVRSAEALRLAAAPGSVLVGRATRAATEGIFEWGETKDAFLAPGAPVLVGSVLAGARARPSAEAGRRRLAAAATLVGRDPELAVLGEAVRATVSGGGGAVLLVGEPGLGKSRLVAECRKYFMGWVGAASGRLPLWLEGRCASYASSSPYGAYQQLLLRFIGAPLEAGEAALRAAFEAATHAVLGNDRGPVPLLARLVGLDPGPAGAHLARMGPPELQQVTFAAMRTLLTRLVERGPTVLAIEDLHWSDPTSLRLTAHLARLAAEAPLLVLATRRPEPDPGVGELEAELSADPALGFQRLELAALEKSAERRLARSLLGGEADEEVLEMVCDGADGNPLFLEERLASLLDTGALARAEGGWRIGQGDSTPLPEALERLIRSRIDRLSTAAREAIVAASVLGEEVERSALAAVSELDTELGDALGELVSAGLLTEASGQGELSYRFRHALIREATYNGLLRPQRRQLHARAAWSLETSAEDRLEDVAAVLGRHFAAAGEGERAVHYLEMAGDHARRLYANEEAIAAYRDALAVIDATLSPTVVRDGAFTAERSAIAAVLCGKLGMVFRLIDRFGEARAAVLDGLARAPDEDRLLVARLQGSLSNIEMQDRRYDAALAAADAAEESLGPGPFEDEERAETWALVQLCGRASVHFILLELGKAASEIERARPFVEAGGSQQLRSYLLLAEGWLHLGERRFRVDEEIVDEWRRIADPARWAAAAADGSGVLMWFFQRPEPLRCLALSWLGSVLTWHGELGEARRVHEEALASVARQGSPGARASARRPGDHRDARGRCRSRARAGHGGAHLGSRRRISACHGCRDRAASVGRLA